MTQPVQIEIAPMRSDQLGEVVRVWVASRWKALPWLEERMGYSDEQNLAHFRDVIAAESEVLVALAQDRVVGLMALGNAEIDQLFIDPSWQRRGVGTALLDLARARFPGGLGLFTHQRNTRARAFYEKHGFAAVRLGVSPPPESEPDVRYEWSGESPQR